MTLNDIIFVDFFVYHTRFYLPWLQSSISKNKAIHQPQSTLIEQKNQYGTFASEEFVLEPPLIANLGIKKRNSR